MPSPTEISATVSSKGQVVIPSDVRKRLGLVQGSVIRFILSEEGVRLVASSGDVRRLKGRLPKPPRPVSLADMETAITEQRAAIGRG